MIAHDAGIVLAALDGSERAAPLTVAAAGIRDARVMEAGVFVITDRVLRLRVDERAARLDALAPPGLEPLLITANDAAIAGVIPSPPNLDGARWALSADGRRLALRDDTGLYVVRTDGANASSPERRLEGTVHPAREGLVGDSLVVLRDGELWDVSLGERPEARVLPDGAGEAWTPVLRVGDQLAYQYAAPNRFVGAARTLALGGGRPRPIAAEGVAVWDLVGMTADGRSVVVQTHQGRSMGLFLAPTDGPPALVPLTPENDAMEWWVGFVR
ncbi:MAG: hypothetical protein H6704_09990 [Myxococcales bacterium]|nr:hypothetical protein [Myxococcales bacterium]